MGKINKTLVLVLLLLGCLPLNAHTAKNDTTYYVKPEGNWHLRTRSDLFGSDLMFVMPYAGEFKSVEASTGTRFKQCFGVGWKSLFLNIGFNPFAKQKDSELNLNVYGNKFGLELLAGESATMSGTYGSGMNISNIVKNTLNPGDLQVLYGKAKVYYAFNWKHFSFSAAMNQNRIQKRSAGSPLITVEARWLYLSHLDDAERVDLSKGLMANIVGIGGGYAYNWVPAKNLLVHASLLANIGILSNAIILNGWNNRNVVRSDTVFSLNGNASVVYHFKHWYVGAFATVDELLSLSLTPEKTNTYIIDYRRSDAHLAIGVRF